MTKLDLIIAQTKERIRERRAELSREDLNYQLIQSRATGGRKPLRLFDALQKSPTGVIAELKRQSPSEGALQASMEPPALARSYVENGATALSVLTERDFFKGSLEDLKAVRAACPQTPILMKDFIVDESQIIEGYLEGADAILLIVSALSTPDLQRLHAFASALDLSILVEVHDAKELQIAIGMKASLIGVNNRNLKTLAVDLEVSRTLARPIENAILISESGISTASDVRELRALGYHGFLMGTHFLKAASPGQALGRLIGELA